MQGERVKEVRKAQNMTLEEFGKRLNVTKVTMSNIERGHRGLTERMLKDICREFNEMRTGCEPEPVALKICLFRKICGTLTPSADWETSRTNSKSSVLIC